MIAEYATYAVGAILIAACLLELRTGRIPNWLTLLIVALFVVVVVLADDRAALIWQVALAAGVFAAGLVMFAIGGMGAGAVKLSAALALFIPLDQAFYTLLVFLGVFFVFAFLIVQIRKLFGSDDSRWHVMANGVIPLSFPIAVAGIVGLFVL